jgi:hypothetical protein
MFKIAMKSNAKISQVGHPNIVNLLTKMWKIVFNSMILYHNISKYVKLTQIVMI